MIDATVTEAAVADVDDGSCLTSGSTWTSSAFRCYGAYSPGLSFRVLDLDGTETIDSAYIYAYVTASASADQEIYIDDRDSAPGFYSGSCPPVTDFTGYSAGGDRWEGNSTGYFKKMTVTTAISHIIGRAGWGAGGKNIRFGGDGNNGGGTLRFQDYPSANTAYLVVNYTAGGVVLRRRREGMI